MFSRKIRKGLIIPMLRAFESKQCRVYQYPQSPTRLHLSVYTPGDSQYDVDIDFGENKAYLNGYEVNLKKLTEMDRWTK